MNRKRRKRKRRGENTVAVCVHVCIYKINILVQLHGYCSCSLL